MARLIIPGDFTSQVTLLANMIAQNNLLGTNSPLIAFLKQQSIVLEDDVAAGSKAQNHENNRALLSKQSEKYRQLRDNNFKAPWSHLTGSAQFLKQFYKGNTKELGNWGFTITAGGKVKYPSKFIDRTAVFAVFLKKHNSYAGGTSPLQPYLTQQNINFKSDGALTEAAAADNNSFTAADQQCENETQLRNRLWQPVLEHIKTIGSFLMKLFSNNPKALGAWGFVVDDSPQKPRLRTTKLKLGEKITGKSVVIGSTVTNVGEGDLHLYRGSSTMGRPVIINKGEQFGIAKGFSVITVVNPSMLTEGRFSWVTNG